MPWKNLQKKLPHAKPQDFSDKIWLVLKGLGHGATNKVLGFLEVSWLFSGWFYEEFIYSLQK